MKQSDTLSSFKRKIKPGKERNATVNCVDLRGSGWVLEWINVAFVNSVKTKKNLYICIFIAIYFELCIVFFLPF